MQVLGFLAIIFGPIMEWIYRFIPNYGWALIVFTLLTVPLIHISEPTRRS